MFDEESSIWIKIFKGFTIIICIGALIGGFIFLFETGDPVFFGIMIAASVVVYITNMLIIQFLNNVQIIREKLEQLTQQDSSPLFGGNDLPNL